jgi:hypothetical protein
LSANDQLPAISAIQHSQSTTSETSYLYQQPNDGEYWWLVGNTRRWLDRRCAGQHIEAGSVVHTIDYSVLKDIPRDDGPCPSIASVLPNPTPEPVATNLHQQPNGGEFWWLASNTRRWLSRDCAGEHIESGAIVSIIQYSVLKDMPRDDGPCPPIQVVNPQPAPQPAPHPAPQPAPQPTPEPNENLENLRNNDPLFRRHETLTSQDLTGLGFYHDSFTQPASAADNGSSPQGQFRISCQYSHFAFDDPIVKPLQPGEAHLHMFWGNTKANAFTRFNEQTTLGDPNDIMESGGSTCQAFELNRSAYWVPALLTSRHSPRSVVIPDNIIIYYKSYRPKEVNPLPAGIQFVAGNVGHNGMAGESFSPRPQLYWSCGRSGAIRSTSGRIPTDCKAGEYINATISFPQCLAVDGNGKPMLSSPDFKSHTLLIPNNDACPGSHPYRVPQVSYLLYYPNGTDGAGAGVANWVLSSDKSIPGGSLHGDWLGGWHELAIQKWIDGCYDPDGNFAGSRNCSMGQTGQNGTNRQFRRVSRLNDYTGPNFLPLD